MAENFVDDNLYRVSSVSTRNVQGEYIKEYVLPLRKAVDELPR